MLGLMTFDIKSILVLAQENVPFDPIENIILKKCSDTKLTY